MELVNRCAEIRHKFNLLKNLKAIEDKKLQSAKDERDSVVLDIETLEGTQNLLATLTRILVDREIKPIQDFVTFGLKKVFSDLDLEFKIEKKETASGTNYEFVLRNGDIEDTIDDSFGGSVEEIASLMLRLIMLQRLRKAPFLAMDEFFTGVDSRHRLNLINLLQILCTKAGFDIFLITHQEDFINGANKVLQAFSTEDGLKIKEVKMHEDSKRDHSEAQKVPQTA